MSLSETQPAGTARRQCGEQLDAELVKVEQAVGVPDQLQQSIARHLRLALSAAYVLGT